MGHNLPYQTHTFSLVRACWSCICRSIEKFTFKVQRGTLAQSSGDCALAEDNESDRVRKGNLKNLIVFVFCFFYLLTFLY